MALRPPPAFAFLAAALVASAVACEDIGLSTSTSGSPSTPAAAGGSASPEDAGMINGPAPPDGTAAVAASADGGSTIVGNPLCFVSYGDAGGEHACLPDTSLLCPTYDAGAGIYNPLDASASDDGGAIPEVPSACHVVANGQKCEAPGTGGDGAQCLTSTDCAPSFECVGSPGQCRHYCCGGNATCDGASSVTTSASFCDVQTTAVGNINVPVCEPISSCALLTPCPTQGQTCAIVKDDGTTSCVAIGPVGVGGDCDVYHCAAELTCLGAVGSRTCYQLCQVDSPVCPSGTTCTSSAQLFANANVGICQ
jgi:hypothetical protein